MVSGQWSVVSGQWSVVSGGCHGSRYSETCALTVQGWGRSAEYRRRSVTRRQRRVTTWQCLASGKRSLARGFRMDESTLQAGGRQADDPPSPVLHYLTSAPTPPPRTSLRPFVPSCSASDQCRRPSTCLSRTRPGMKDETSFYVRSTITPRSSVKRSAGAYFGFTPAPLNPARTR